MQQTNQTAYLIIQFGHRWTDVLRLQPDHDGFVGRSSECQVVVRDERVSRKHARVFSSDGGWFVEDLGSRNGTWVGGKSIAGKQTLSDGDIITIGGCEIAFAQSLSTGFAARNTVPGVQLDKPRSDGQQTRQIDGPPPAIVERLAASQWSSGDLDREGFSYDLPAQDRMSEMWGFFYRLVFELVGCETPEAAAQVALDRMLSQLQLSSGGIVVVEPWDGSASAVEPNPDLPAMAVLAARQATGSVYHRISDFLAHTVIHDRQAVLARNVQDDAQLSLARASGQRGTASIICAPLREKGSDGERVIGLLHVYSTDQERMLTDVDLNLAVGVADNLAIALARQLAGDRLARDLRQTQRKLDQLEEQLELTSEMVGHSVAIQRVQRAIERAAPTPATLLIRGQSGVGKELVARAVHRQSQRKQGPFVCLNCAALAPTLLESELFGHEKGAFTGATDRKIGKFEAADGGTLLLDEIGEMIPELQAKFLRVLEGQPFERLGGNKPIHTDVRVIAATNRDLERAVEEKQFRSDLYFRLRVVEIEVPPLQARLEDVPELVEHFLGLLRHHASRRISGVEPAALELMCRYHWPGNIRELRNVIERAVVLGSGSTISVEDLSLAPLKTSATPPMQHASETATPTQAFQPIPLAALERQHIYAVLEYCKGNKSKASHLLGIERSTLDRKLKRYDESNE